MEQSLGVHLEHGEIISAKAIENELEQTGGAAPVDHGTDLLPFSQISGARFELLAYQLLRAEIPPPAGVTLLQVSGDKGRDVLVYSRGLLVAIVQCKNLQERLTAPAVVWELLKLALHAYLTAGLLPARKTGSHTVAVDFWAPEGFTAPAAAMIDEWPKHWTRDRIGRAFPEIQQAYARFNSIAWEQAHKFVVDQFAQTISLRKTVGTDISLRVRRQSQIYQRFFQGHVLASLGDVERVVGRALRDSHWRQMTEEDVRRIYDRINEFSVEQRACFGNGYLLGVTSEFLSLLTEDERQTLIKEVMMHGAQVMRLTERMADRIIVDHVARLALSFRALRNPKFPVVLCQYLSMRFASRVLRHSVPKFLEQPVAPMPFAATLPCLADMNRASFEASGEPRFVPSTNDVEPERPRERLAQCLIAGISSASDFERTALEDWNANRESVEALVERMDLLLPSNVVVISDAATPLNNKQFFAHVVSIVAASNNRECGEHSLDSPAPPPRSL
jgi:hypothetical protein